MFWIKKPDDYRIAEQFVPEANNYVFKVERNYGEGWCSVQVCTTFEKAKDMVERYRKADNPTYHYV